MTTFLDKAGLTYLWTKLKEQFQPKTIIVRVTGNKTSITGAQAATAIRNGTQVIYRSGTRDFYPFYMSGTTAVWYISFSPLSKTLYWARHSGTAISTQNFDLSIKYSLTMGTTDAAVQSQKSELTSFITNYGRPVSFLHMGSTTTLVGVTGKTTGGQWIALALNGSGVTLYLMTEPQAPDFTIFDASGNFVSGNDGLPYIKGATLEARK